MSEKRIGTQFDFEQVRLIKSAGDFTFYIQSVKDKDYYTRLSPAQAYEVYDFIEENFERPKEPTLFEKQWPEVPIGAEFGFGPDGGDYPYRKTSEAEYRFSLGGFSDMVSGLTPGDHARGVYWREEPTIIEKFAALKLGDKFRFSCDGDEDPAAVKITNERYVNLGSSSSYEFQSHKGATYTIEAVE